VTRHLQAQHLCTHSCQASLGLQVHLLSLPTGWLPCTLQCKCHLALHAAKQMTSCACCHGAADSMVQLTKHDCCTRITAFALSHHCSYFAHRHLMPTSKKVCKHMPSTCHCKKQCRATATLRFRLPNSASSAYSGRVCHL